MARVSLATHKHCIMDWIDGIKTPEQVRLCARATVNLQNIFRGPESEKLAMVQADLLREIKRKCTQLGLDGSLVAGYV